MDRREFVRIGGVALSGLAGCESPLSRRQGEQATHTNQDPGQRFEGEEGWFEENPRKWYGEVFLLIRELRTPWEADAEAFAENYSQNLKQRARDLVMPGVETLIAPDTVEAAIQLTRSFADSISDLQKAEVIAQTVLYRTDWKQSARQGEETSETLNPAQKIYRELNIDLSTPKPIKPLFDVVLESFNFTVDDKRKMKIDLRETVRTVIDIFELPFFPLENTKVPEKFERAFNENLRNYRAVLNVLDAALTYDLEGEQKSDSSKAVAIDGFEDGDISEYSGQTGGFRVQQSVVKNGNWSLKGQVQNGENQTIHRSVNFSQPSRVQGYVRVGHGGGNENAHISYFSGGPNGSQPLHVDFNMNSGNSGFGDTSGEPELFVNGQMVFDDIRYNTWYFAELQAIDWSSETVGKVFVDGSLKAENVDFQASASSIDTLELKVNDWGDEPAWFDDVSIGGEKANLQLEGARLVQRLEDTQIIGDSSPEVDEPLNPLPVSNLSSTLLFELSVENLDVLDETDKVRVTYRRDEEQLGNSFELTKQDLFVIANAVNRSAAGAKIVETAGGDLPIFSASEETETYKITIEPADGTISNTVEQSIDAPPALAKMPELNVGYIWIQDPDNGKNYKGSTGDGGVTQERYSNFVDNATDYLQKTYPTRGVNSYAHSYPDPVIGTDDSTEDMKKARDKLETVLENAGGSIGSVDHFDVTVAIVPDGYFDFHNIDASGFHISSSHGPGGIIHKVKELKQTQPQASVAVHEVLGGLSTHEPDNGKTAAQEISHHFLPDPTYPDVMAMRRDSPIDPIDNHHARFNNDLVESDDPPAVKTMMYDLLNDPPRAKLRESFMSYSLRDSWTDAHIYNTLIHFSEGTNQFQPAIPETSSHITDVLSGVTEINDDGEIEFTRTWKRTGMPMADAGNGAVSIEIRDPNDEILDEFAVHDFIERTNNNPEGPSVIVSEDKFLFTFPFPRKTSTISAETDDTVTELNPIERSVRDVIKEIPDAGFINRPDERRIALFNDLDAIDKQMDQGAFRSAKQKMQQDIRNKLEQWLKNDYSTIGLQPTKQEMLDLVDDMIDRLETLAQESKRKER